MNMKSEEHNLNLNIDDIIKNSRPITKDESEELAKESFELTDDACVYSSATDDDNSMSIEELDEVQKMLTDYNDRSDDFLSTIMSFQDLPKIKNYMLENFIQSINIKIDTAFSFDRDIFVSEIR